MTDTKEVALNKLQQLDVKIQEDLQRYTLNQRAFGKGRSSIEEQIAAQALGVIATT